MDYPHLIYHLAVLRLERLRLSALVTSSKNEYDYSNMFLYVENQMVLRSKGVRDQVLKEIALTLYREYLNMERDLGRSVDVDANLFKHVQLLWVKFNSTNGTSRRIVRARR